MPDTDAEQPIETTAIVVQDQREVLMRGANDAARRSDTANLLATVKRVVARKGATVTLPNARDKYLLVDTWRAVGAACGVFACTIGDGVWYDDPLTGKPAYRVTVEARYGDVVVGTATGTCSSGETIGKQNKLRWSEAHAVEAMAQTRGTSRALRNALGWLVDEVDGYSATAAEELPAEALQGARRSGNTRPQAQAARNDEGGGNGGGGTLNAANTERMTEQARKLQDDGNTAAFDALVQTADRMGLTWNADGEDGGVFEAKE